MSICIAERSVCAIRIVRLGTDCAPLTGPSNGAVATAIATITLTPEVEEGTRTAPKDGCGRTVYVAEDPDVTLGYTAEMELVTSDFELLELLTDASLMLGGPDSPWDGEAMGVQMPGFNTPAGDGVGMEIWTKVASGTGVCGPADTNPPYMVHLLPRTRWRSGARTMDGEHANQSFSGKVSNNVMWGEGPWGDWQAVEGLNADSPYAKFFAADIPEASCGYIDVPAGD
jgi:hypothetical protein